MVQHFFRFGPLLALLACPVVAERSEKATEDFGDDSGDSGSDSGDTADSACEEQTWFLDDDADGFGWAAASFTSCEPPDSYVADSLDCDDLRADVFPGAPETCDGTDQDCDTVVDNDATDALIWYLDGDADGYGSSLDEPTSACTQPEGYVPTGDDCNDADVGIYPGALEHCDSMDEDCDTNIDNDAVDADSWYEDLDGDGHGNPDVRTDACEPPAGTSADDLDCDDQNAEIFPDAAERCDGIDEDCDGNIDENPIDPQTWYLDVDGDGFGTDTLDFVGCEAIDGYVSENTDCDDTDATVFPGAMDMCDGVDVDCDGTIDEADSVGVPTWYLDGDSDGFAGTTTIFACTVPDGYLADPTDCDDANAEISPGADEVCGGADENCDGAIDEVTAIDTQTWYADLDSDTYGDPTTATISCTAPTSFVLDGTDCDDAAADTHPAGIDTCADGLDQNCDGEADEGCWPVGTISTADAATTITGTIDSQLLGWSFAGGGDLTGDGTTDLLSIASGTGSAELYVLDAASLLSTEAPGAAVLASRTLGTNNQGPSAGDLDGDGSFDLVISTDGSGYTLVEYGPITGSAALASDATIGSDFKTFAYGDLNSDGVNDLAASVKSQNKVVLLSEPSGGTPLSSGLTIRDAAAGSGSWLGCQLATGDDLDGDGIDDLVFGGESNQVWLFAGPPSDSDVSAADLVLAADEVSDPAFGRFGLAISPDADGDGYGEIATSSYPEVSFGSLDGQQYIFSGALTGSADTGDAYAQIAPDASMPSIGFSLGYADVDGDGLDDLVTGGSKYAISVVGVLFSPISGTISSGVDADTLITGTTVDFAFRSGIVPVGDLLGWGFEGFAVSDAGVDTSLNDVGAIYVFYGP